MEFSGLSAGLGELGVQGGDGVVAGPLGGCATDGVRDVGVPFCEHGGGAVDGGVADAGFAGEVLLDEDAVGTPHTGTTHTVLSNTSPGAWPLARHLDGISP